jgi:hypothetical protein
MTIIRFFDQAFGRFIDGSRFSHDQAFRFPSRAVMLRDDYLVSLARGANILHIGCVDHLDLIEEKIRDDTYLHKSLCKAASLCVGVDLNEDGIEHMRELGFDNLHCGDLNGDEIPDALSDITFDYAIFGEILEHVDNPTQFLRDFRNKYKNVRGVIITVPNALRHTNIVGALRSIEKINTDHRYWFTPFTIAKVQHRAGLELENILMTSFSSNGLFKRILFRLFPLMADSIVCVSKM